MSRKNAKIVSESSNSTEIDNHKHWLCYELALAQAVVEGRYLVTQERSKEHSRRVVTLHAKLGEHACPGEREEREP